MTAVIHLTAPVVDNTFFVNLSSVERKRLMKPLITGSAVATALC